MPQESASASDHIDLGVGSPAPLGASAHAQGFNFALYAPHASCVVLGLFCGDLYEPVHEICLDPATNRTGDVWHVRVAIDTNFAYGYRLQHHDGDTVMESEWLLDPYATGFVGRSKFGPRRGQPLHTRRCLSADTTMFDWQGVRAPRVAWSDTVIYEMHVRGFTRAIDMPDAGTYAGIIKKIPYLVNLGVTTLELLPVFEFEEDTKSREHPDTGEPLLNVWGYDPISFFAPKAGFAHDTSPHGAAREFKQMVRELHRAGIEVVLDVVYNHTGEGERSDPYVAYRALSDDTYYHQDAAGQYQNFSGCGNTFNCNHPVVADLIVSSLRHWVSEFHVDGFRFDLASILTRDQSGAPTVNPPLIERIVNDPVLSSSKLIAEAWDASGLHQVGHFPGGARFAEWNDSFRDTIRRFLRGEEGLVHTFAQVMNGSEQLYEASGRLPHHSINFVTCHDGFTLRDLVSYSGKCNLDNGEDNRDGAHENLSWNCGVEGPSNDPDILALRSQQSRNFLTLMMLASGTPMLLAGDEFGRTQRGNNNAWCQDNPISWIDWMTRERNADLMRFVRKLIEIRHELAPLRRSSYRADERQPHINWHGVKLGTPDWAPHSRSLAMESIAADESLRSFLVVNAYWEPLEFQLPPCSSSWQTLVDTHCTRPNPIRSLADSPYPHAQATVLVAARSVRLLVARAEVSADAGPDR